MSVYFLQYEPSLFFSFFTINLIEIFRNKYHKYTIYYYIKGFEMTNEDIHEVDWGGKRASYDCNLGIIFGSTYVFRR